MESEIRELRRGNELLKTASGSFAQAELDGRHRQRQDLRRRGVRAELPRQGHAVARCTVERLMRTAGLRGITRAEGLRTTVPGTGPDTRDIDDLKIAVAVAVAVAVYIDGFERRRLKGEIGLVPPAEHEDTFHRHNTSAATVLASVPRVH